MHDRCRFGPATSDGDQAAADRLLGDEIPEATVQTFGDDNVQEASTTELFAGKRVVLFGVPGAFTPGCSRTHLPGFIAEADAIKAKGVDAIVCMAVNDAFVMNAWCSIQGAQELVMLADGNAEFTKALGLEMDASGFGMGIRCKRFAMVLDDGVVESLVIDESGKVKKTAAENVLAVL